MKKWMREWENQKMREWMNEWEWKIKLKKWISEEKVVLIVGNENEINNQLSKWSSFESRRVVSSLVELNYENYVVDK